MVALESLDEGEAFGAIWVQGAAVPSHQEQLAADRVAVGRVDDRKLAGAQVRREVVFGDGVRDAARRQLVVGEKGAKLFGGYGFAYRLRARGPHDCDGAGDGANLLGGPAG